LVNFSPRRQRVCYNRNKLSFAKLHFNMIGLVVYYIVSFVCMVMYF